MQKWGSLVVLSLALAIIVIDTTLLNVSLGTIIREFNTTIQSIQWVITAYSLVLAALTITGGRLGDLLGRKRMFLLGAVIFAVGSFIASDSTNVPQMIWGEAIIEGIGAALMMPATASLLVANFQGRERAIAFGVWGGIAAAASAIGPILGGYLTTNYSWRWGFRINVVVAGLILIGSVLIKESRDTKEKQSLDFVGVLLSALGMLGLVFGFIEASTYGWWIAKMPFVINDYSFPTIGGLSIVPWSLLAGLIFLTLFFLWQNLIEKRGQTPLVSTHIFQNRQFAAGSLTTAIMSLGMTGLIFVIPVFLQAVRGLDAYHTGLALLPMSVSILVAAPLSVFLSTRVGPKGLILTGLFLNALGGLILRQLINVDATAWSLAPGFMVFGFGIGLVMAQISNLTLSAVPVAQAGEASGINNTLRQVGSTLGSAIIGSVMLTALSTNLAAGITNSQLIPSQLKGELAVGLTNQTSSVEFGSGLQVAAQIPPVIKNEIIAISHIATVDADRLAMLYAAGFAFLGFLSAFWLPRIKPSEHGVSQPGGGH